MSSVLVHSTSTAEAREREELARIAEEEERIAKEWEAVPVKCAAGDIDYMWRYRKTGEIVFQPDVSLLSLDDDFGDLDDQEEECSCIPCRMGFSCVDIDY